MPCRFEFPIYAGRIGAPPSPLGLKYRHQAAAEAFTPPADPLNNINAEPAGAVSKAQADRQPLRHFRVTHALAATGRTAQVLSVCFCPF